jgi:thioredoxin 1
MKKLSFLFVTCLASGVLYGNPSSENNLESQQLQIVFQQDFLEASDNELLDLAVYRALISTDSGLTPGELKEKFKSLASQPDVEERFLSIYASMFDEQELHEAYGLLQDERYLKLRKKLSLANYMCFEESEKMLGEVVLDTEPAEPEQPKNSIVYARADNMEELLNSGRPVIIDAYTDWCGPCKFLTLVMKELNNQYGDVYQFAKLNAEKERALARSLGITAYPTVLFFKDGKEVGRHKGFMSKEVFLGRIKQFFNV